MQQYARAIFETALVRPLELAVIIPVLNERDNVGPLLDRLNVVLADREWEAIFVDDGSTDGTLRNIEARAGSDRRVRLIRRFGRRGLASAVLEGALATVAPVIAVIDGDMQHDEAVLPQLIDAISVSGAELAIGTRYMEGGGTGDWSSDRVRVSRWATRLAALVMRTPLSDPMSGFFAIRRAVLIEAAPHLSVTGYKILLDIVASHPRTLAFAELPYTFRSRAAGASKLDSAIALEYIELLLDKLVGRIVPVKFVLFSAIGTVGAFVHLGVLALMRNFDEIGFVAAQIAAVIVSMTCNFALNNQLTYRDRRHSGWRWWTGYACFALACSIGAIANVGVGAAIYGWTQHNWWLGGVAGIAVGSVWNYVATRWLTWRER